MVKSLDYIILRAAAVGAYTVDFVIRRIVHACQAATMRRVLRLNYFLSSSCTTIPTLLSVATFPNQPCTYAECASG